MVKVEEEEVKKPIQALLGILQNAFPGSSKNGLSLPSCSPYQKPANEAERMHLIIL